VKFLYNNGMKSLFYRCREQHSRSIVDQWKTVPFFTSDKFYIVLFILIILVACKSKTVQSQAAGSIKSQDTLQPAWLAKNYRQVISIEEKHVTQQAGNYLLDVPIAQNPDSTYVFLLNTKVPLQLLIQPDGFYPELREFIVIVPDWKFYSEIAEEASKKGMCIEPAASNFYYYIQREVDRVKIDSIRLCGLDNPTIDFADLGNPGNKLTVYRKESYGSVCCPRDPRWDSVEQDESFIRDFEARKKIKVTRGRYVEKVGKEGERNIYYTLPALTGEQRLEFLLERSMRWQLDKGDSGRASGPKLFTPQLLLMTNTGFNRWTEMPG
jgi:hypothetical protein